MTDFRNSQRDICSALHNMVLDNDMLQAALLRDLPAGTTLELEAELPDTLWLIIKDKGNFDYQFCMDDDGSCKFESADMKIRGTNLSALVLRNMVEVLPQFGRYSIDLFAAEIGSYLWGRAGFAPYQSEWSRIVPQLEQRLDYLVSVNKNTDIQHAANEIRQDLAQRNPKAMWKIVDRKEKMDDGNPLGKAMFLQWLPEYFPAFDALTKEAPKELRDVVCWRGTLDLRDSESDDRLYEYIESAEKILVDTKAPVTTGMTLRL